MKLDIFLQNLKYTLRTLGRDRGFTLVDPTGRLFLTGRRFTADEAKQIGLVHAVVPADQLDAAVEKYLAEILAAGREAIAASKALVRRICECSPEEAQRLCVAAIAERRVSPEAQDRMKAFLKRD